MKELKSYFNHMDIINEEIEFKCFKCFQSPNKNIHDMMKKWQFWSTVEKLFKLDCTKWLSDNINLVFLWSFDNANTYFWGVWQETHGRSSLAKISNICFHTWETEMLSTNRNMLTRGWRNTCLCLVQYSRMTAEEWFSPVKLLYLEHCHSWFLYLPYPVKVDYASQPCLRARLSWTFLISNF